MTPPRAAAFRLLTRVEDDGAWLDRVVAADRGVASMDRRDRALTDALTATTLQRQITLDHFIEALTDRTADSIQVSVRVALRLGLAQVLYMDGMADHAAVSQTVDLNSHKGERGFLNAVLRRATRERDALLGGLSDASPIEASIAHGMPLWIVESWWERFGPAMARVLLAAQNTPGETALRVNGLLSDGSRGLDALRAAGVNVETAPWPKGALLATGPLDIGDRALRENVVVQARGAQLATTILPLAEGASVVELCAAPGGKTLALAEAVGPSGRVTAIERDPRRAQQLSARLDALGASKRVDVVVADAREYDAGQHDFALVDPPCSALGILRSRPDRRHHARREAIAGLCELQKGILRNACRMLGEGGLLTWCTCTTTLEENEAILRPLINANVLEPVGLDIDGLDGVVDLADIGGGLVVPDPGDGFVVAALKRTSSALN